MTQVDAGWRRVDESMGFDPGQEALTFHQHKRLALSEPVYVPENGYIYIWVSNESEGTKVWFDDVKITHTQVIVTQASDYGVWGDELRKLKAPDFTYRHGYQGNFSEKDKETGWNHFEAREYDPLIGRWLSVDPKRQYFSPYVSMGNNPISIYDPNGKEGLPAIEVILLQYGQASKESILFPQKTVFEKVVKTLDVVSNILMSDGLETLVVMEKEAYDLANENMNLRMKDASLSNLSNYKKTLSLTRAKITCKMEPLKEKIAALRQETLEKGLPEYWNAEQIKAYYRDLFRLEDEQAMVDIEIKNVDLAMKDHPDLEQH
jgi:RHS repeat-associated protein